MLIGIPKKDPKATETVSAVLKVQLRGLVGGAPNAPSVAEARVILSDVLESKGLSGVSLTAKVEETFAKVTKPEITHWALNPSWQALKTLVGTRVTFLSRKKETDPLTVNDPWLSALKNKPRAEPKQPRTDKESPSAQVALIASVWANEDGTEPQLLDKPQNGASGIVLMTPQVFISSWQDTTLPLSTDELAVIVWPPVDPVPTHLDPEMVTFPARLLSSEESTSLLCGHMFQFGQKKVMLRSNSNPAEFPQRASVSLLIEVIQAEVGEELWASMIEHPLEAIKKQVEIITPIIGNWGLRFWSNKNKASRPKDATRITVNVMVAKDKLSLVLALSGQVLWMSPRLDQEEYSCYRPVWVPGTLQEVRIMHAKLQGGCGLIRSKRGLAIRVETTNFDNIRKTLVPEMAARPDIGPANALFDYKLSPAPVGATSDDVLTFLGRSFPSVKSTVRKQIGPRTWVVSFASELSDKYIQAKEGFIILQPLNSSRKKDPVRDAVLVGNPRLLKEVSASSNNTIAQVLHGGLQQSSHPRPPAPGPVQEALDAKIKASEEKMKALLVQHKEEQTAQTKQLADTIDEHKRDQDSRLRNMEHDIQRHQRETTDAVNDLKQTMSEQFANMLTEITKMNRRDSKRSPAPSPDEPQPKAVKPQ